jgi:hypothetical protein
MSSWGDDGGREKNGNVYINADGASTEHMPVEETGRSTFKYFKHHATHETNNQVIF